MDFEIIDFHTHPFLTPDENICSHKENCDMSPENTKRDMEALGISHIAGSLISSMSRGKLPKWEELQYDNNTALKLREMYGDFYIPGFHVHPSYVKESCEEIDRMDSLGVKLIGELVPYCHGWEDYSCKGFDEILDCAEDHHMIVSFHSMGEDAMDRMVEKHPNVTFVAAHPGELNEFNRHMERMKKSENYYLDLSGYGIFRHGMLRHAIDLFGAERFIFGSDYPTCNPAMYVGGVLLDWTIKDSEKELIFSGNAKRLLSL